jgi:two-component system, OmpR family, sensor histidine kinase MtrB
MQGRGVGLRSTLTWGALVLAALALLAAITVMGLTSVLHGLSPAIETSTESVRLAEEAQVDLLLHGQADNPLVRQDLAGGMLDKLSEAEAYVATEREGEVLDTAIARVQDYVHGSRDPSVTADQLVALHADAYTAIGDLVSVNVSQAQAAVRLAARLDDAANVVGLAVALLVVGVTGVLVYWVHGPLARPVLDLAGAMNRFGQGDHATRTVVTGPREVREMAERFNQMAAQIEQQRLHQQAFLAGVAHDLRNPVSVLLLATEAARSDPSIPPDHRARRVLDRTARQLSRLERLISDVLDSIDAVNLELRLEPCDLRDIVRFTVDLFMETAPRHQLVLSLPPDPVETQADPLRVEQVATNLISNAIKYSPEGGRIEIAVGRRGDDAVLTVADHGLGMSPAARALLFTPFHRDLSRATIPGMGLGLFVARRIVDAHGGTIDVDTTPGEGSTFRVFLPSAREGVGVRPVRTTNVPHTE